MVDATIQNRPLIRADRLWHLKRSVLAWDISTEDIEAIGELCSDRIYCKESQIFAEGDPVRYFYILNRGYVQLSVGEQGKNPKVLRLLKGGEVFGEEIFGRGSAYQATATAYQECWTSLLPRKRLLQLMGHRPGLSLNLIRILTQRLLEARIDLRDGALEARQRVARTLLKLGELHGQPILGAEGLRKLKIRVSHRRLASLIGGSRPHISKILSEFKKLGIVDYKDRKILLDMESLAGVIGH